MAEEKALEYFHGKERYNCAQAVIKTFQEEFNISEEEIQAAARKGTGRAEGGLCGALYGALYLVKDENLKQEITAAFEKEAGAIQCRQVRKVGKLTCRGCVRFAAKQVEEITMVGELVP